MTGGSAAAEKVDAGAGAEAVVAEGLMLETSMPSCATASAAGTEADEEGDDADGEDDAFSPASPACVEEGESLAESRRNRVPAGGTEAELAAAAASLTALGSIAAAATDATVECWQHATTTLRQDCAAAALALFRFRRPRVLPAEAADECGAHTVSVNVPLHLRPSVQRASARSPTISAGQQRQNASSQGVWVQPAHEQHHTATRADSTATAAVPPMPPPTAAAHLDDGSTTLPSLASAVGVGVTVALADAIAVAVTVTRADRSSGLTDGEGVLLGDAERLGLRDVVGVDEWVRVGVADAGGQPLPPHPGATLSLGEAN